MKREIWLDFLRVTACFLVMTVHSTEPFYLGGDGTLVLTSADAFWVSLFEGIARCCVPLFVMASGYLQLPLHYPTGEFFRRRAIRIVVPMVFWTLVYAFVWGHPVANIKGLLFNFNYAAGHLWFVYMLLGLYLIMPLLSPWLEKVSRKELGLYLGLWAVTLCIPFVREYAGGMAPMIYAKDGLPAPALFPLWGEASWNPFGLFYYVSGFVGYLLLGVFVKRFVPGGRLVKALGWTLFLIGFILQCFGFLQRIAASGSFPVAGSVELAVSWECAIAFCGLPVALTTLGLFLVYRSCHPESSSCHPERSRGISFYNILIKPLSEAGYGMYLMHMLVLGTVSAWLRGRLGIGPDGLLGPVWTTPVEILGTALISFVIVGLIAVALRRIPKVGKWIMG
jgi:surface polysaccharide O-acyltransferase-like enzyme